MHKVDGTGRVEQSGDVLPVPIAKKYLPPPHRGVHAQAGMFAGDHVREITAVWVSGTVGMQPLEDGTGGSATRHARLEDALGPKEAHEPVQEREVARPTADVGRSCPGEIQRDESVLAQPNNPVLYLGRFLPECGVDPAREVIEVR